MSSRYKNCSSGLHIYCKATWKQNQKMLKQISRCKTGLLFLILYACFIASAIHITTTIKYSDESFKDKIIYSQGIHVFYSKSRIHCGVICSEQNCPSYFYNHLNRRCQVNDIAFNKSKTATEEPGWKLYGDKGMLV